MIQRFADPVRRTLRRRLVIGGLAAAACAVILVSVPVRGQGRGGGPQGGAPGLEEQHQRLLPLFELAGVVFTDADEANGRIVVGVLDRGIEGLIRGRLPMLGVSAALVDLVETEAIFQVSTLRDKVRPVGGGLQIRFKNYLCSLGFPALRNGVSGFVTASHCSARQGSVDGTKYYQPANAVADEFIGTEIVDPAYTRIADCPAGRKCRYSDANFSRAADDVAFGLGSIARTAAPNTGSLDIVGAFTVINNASAGVGLVANKVGRTTGWTQGMVSNTCVNTGVAGSNVVLLCQAFVENPAVEVSNSGDSGAPVFAIHSGSNVVLLGNLWGSNASNTLFVYSPIANIMSELGSLTTH